MRNALRQLLNNLSAIILALLLAVAVWISATLQADPFDVREFRGVPVTPVNQPENTVLFEGNAARVKVDARAPQSELEKLTISDFVATMDLSAVEPGVRTSVLVSVASSSEAVRIQSVEPEQQPVHLEEVGVITMSVEIEVMGEVATGYYRSTLPDVNPGEVVVDGPVPDLADVASVTGSVNVDGAKEGIEELVAVVPRDAEGRLVPGLQWTPEQVSVSIWVRKRARYKPDVEVVPDVRGDPAPGYRMASVEVEPSTVTLAGPQSVLDELPGFVRTMPISITGATTVLAERTPLTMPTNVVVVGVDFVTVTVDILPILSSRTMTSVVGVQGLSPGLVAVLSPSVVDVILEGPDSRLAELTRDDIQAFVNVGGLGLGVHPRAPVVLAPQEIRVVSVIPETIEVAIALPPTQVPTSTLTIQTPEP